MRDQIGVLEAFKLLLVAFASSGIAFLLLRAAFHPHASVFDPITEPGDYLAVTGTVLIFCVILYRMQQRTWNREQVDKILQIDDESP
jgi:hypothetical protein